MKVIDLLEERETTDFMQMLRDFLPLAMQELEIDKLPPIKLVKNVPEHDQPTFGRFDEKKKTITLGIANRHPLDILRTLAHELAHWRQSLHGQLASVHSGDTGSPQENEAHIRAGIIMRHYNKHFPQYFHEKPIELSEDVSDYEIHNYEKLDKILAMLCKMVIEGQKKDKDYYGMVAACVLDPDNQMVAKINYPTSDGKRVHAERAAMEAYQSKYGEIPEGSIIVTTLSPCNEFSDETADGRSGNNCTDLINNSPVRKVYCGYWDPSQGDESHDERDFNLMETENGKIRDLCKSFADTFLDEDQHPNEVPRGPEFKPTMPAGTVRVDVSDVYDWYKLGKNIANLGRAKVSDFGKGPPSTIMSFGSEPEEHKYINNLKKLGLTTTDIDPKDLKQPKGMKRQKVDPTYNVAEGLLDKFIKPKLKFDFSEAGEELYCDVTLGDETVANFTFDRIGDDLEAQDMHVVAQYRGQGIAQQVYNKLKAQGFNIHRSPHQTDDGAHFWDKNRGAGSKVWEQGLAEGANDYLWHGSRHKNDVLLPRQANDTGGAEGSNKNAIYATPNAKVAIAMGLTTPGSDTGMFPNDPQMVLFKGGIRKGQMVYLHKVPKDLFINHNSREWYSKPEVKKIKPIEIKAVPVDNFLHLIRQATPKDLELQKKYMKENFADGKNPQDKGDSKRHHVPTKSSVSNLRKFAKSHSGRAAQLAHWMANMKSGKKK